MSYKAAKSITVACVVFVMSAVTLPPKGLCLWTI